MNVPATTTTTEIAVIGNPVRNYNLPSGSLEDAMIARMKELGFGPYANTGEHEPEPFEPREIPKGSVSVTPALKAAYDAVAGGADTAVKVQEVLGSEKAHAYKSLRGLEALGLVTATVSRPAIFTPRDPDLVVSVEKTSKELRFEAILSFLSTPKTPGDIEEHTGASRGTINANITEMLGDGLIVQLDTLSRGRRQFIRA